jgi:rSAM/selenodomain-associated transferase 2
MDAFRAMRPGWFVFGIALYGLLFIPASWRWHLALRQTGCAVHPGATARLCLIGHFFYTILFGAAGGDTAKSAFYARWYRLPLAKVLAAAPLDRLMGCAGLILFAGLVLLLAIVGGAFSSLKGIALRWPSGWLFAAMFVFILALLALAKSKGKSVWVKFSKAFLSGAKQLLASPRALFSGVFCGLLVQVGLNGVLAFNLQAVSHAEIPWAQLAWTFPVICIVSALPITVAGLGMREGAALALLGLYGMSNADAVAASLLTLTTGLVWAAAGGFLFWREEERQEFKGAAPKTISAVIPTLNEAATLPETVRHVRAVPEICEIIVVDGGSNDRTREIAGELGCRVLSSPPGRGKQLRLGAMEAKGGVIMMLHADTLLPPEAGQAILNCFRDATVVGGGFWKTFGANRHPLMRGSRFKCAVRLYVGQRIAADQALFVRHEVLENSGGVPDMPLMEEWELCRRLRQAGRLALADATIITSGRRFEKLGVLRTYLRIWWVSMRYRLGTSPKDLLRLYERD